jgi:hypothetical protein
MENTTLFTEGLFTATLITEEEIKALFDAIDSLEPTTTTSTGEDNDIFLTPEEVEAILGEIEDNDPFNI